MTYLDTRTRKEEPTDPVRMLALTKGCEVRSKEVARMLSSEPIFIELDCPGRVSDTGPCYDVGYSFVFQSPNSGEQIARLGRVDRWSRARCGKEQDAAS